MRDIGRSDEVVLSVPLHVLLQRGVPKAGLGQGRAQGGLCGASERCCCQFRAIHVYSTSFFYRCQPLENLMVLDSQYWNGATMPFVWSYNVSPLTPFPLRNTNILAHHGAVHTGIRLCHWLAYGTGMCMLHGLQHDTVVHRWGRTGEVLVLPSARAQ